MEILRRLLLVLALAGLAAPALTACSETAEGIGEDTEDAGERIQRKVD